MPSKNVRISLNDQELLKTAIEETCRLFVCEWKLISLFGSRSDPQKKGGDIDLYIQIKPGPDYQPYPFKNKLLLRLYDLLGEQKIDLVIDDGLRTDAFLELVKKQKVDLWNA